MLLRVVVFAVDVFPLMRDMMLCCCLARCLLFVRAAHMRDVVVVLCALRCSVLLAVLCFGCHAPARCVFV